MQFVQSDADEELLFNVPFTGNIKLKGIIIRGSNDNTHPNRLKLCVFTGYHNSRALVNGQYLFLLTALRIDQR